MTSQRTRKVWVESVKKLYTYEPVTTGASVDIGMAYDVTMKPMNSRPESVDKVGVEEVDDLVALDKIRAELGLYRSDLIKESFNALWGLFNLDKTHFGRSPGNWREYRVGHPKHNG